MNTAWAIPRNSRPNILKSRGRSLLLLGTAGLTVLATTALTALRGSGALGSLGTGSTVLLVAVSVAVNAAVFVLAFRIGTARRLSVRDVALGAVGAAVVWQILQSFGTAYVAQVVHRSTATNGAFALVLGLIAFLYVASVALVLCVEVNVVRARRLYPRALLTPFTDNVDLTAGDRSVYTAQAQAQRTKGFEDIDVRFDRPTDARGPD